MSVVSSATLAHNGLRVAAVGEFGALNCQHGQKFDRSTQLQFERHRQLRQHAVEQKLR